MNRNKRTYHRACSWMWTNVAPACTRKKGNKYCILYNNTPFKI